MHGFGAKLALYHLKERKAESLENMLEVADQFVKLRVEHTSRKPRKMVPLWRRKGESRREGTATHCYCGATFEAVETTSPENVTTNPPLTQASSVSTAAERGTGYMNAGQDLMQLRRAASMHHRHHIRIAYTTDRAEEWQQGPHRQGCEGDTAKTL